MKFSPDYVRIVLNENFEDAKAQFLAPLMAIEYAHLVMLAEQKIVTREDARAIRNALDGISEDESARSATTARTRTSSSISSGSSWPAAARMPRAAFTRRAPATTST